MPHPFLPSRLPTQRRLLAAFVAALAASLVAPAVAAAQTPRDSVLAVIEEFFRTMTANDSAGAARVMRMDGQYYAVRQFPESVTVRRTTHADYLSRLRPGADRFVERMWDPTVLIHGPIAQVWTPYDIYRNNQFSHCGVDSFSLIREREGWKIAGIVYTVEPSGCAPSPLGPLVPPEGGTPEPVDHAMIARIPAGALGASRVVAGAARR